MKRKLFNKLFWLTGFLFVTVSAGPKNYDNSNYEEVKTNAPYEYVLNINPYQQSGRFFVESAKVDTDSYEFSKILTWPEYPDCHKWFDEDWKIIDSGRNSYAHLDWADLTSPGDQGKHTRWSYIALELQVNVPARQDEYKLSINWHAEFDPNWQAGVPFSRDYQLNVFYFGKGKEHSKDTPVIVSPTGKNTGAIDPRPYYLWQTDKKTTKRQYFDGALNNIVMKGDGTEHTEYFYFGYAVGVNGSEASLWQNMTIEDIRFKVNSVSENSFNFYIRKNNFSYGYETFQAAIAAFNECKLSDEAILNCNTPEDIVLNEPLEIKGSGEIRFNFKSLTINAPAGSKYAIKFIPEASGEFMEDQQVHICDLSKVYINGADVEYPIVISRNTEYASTVELHTCYQSTSTTLDNNGFVFKNCPKMDFAISVGDNCALVANNVAMSADNLKPFKSYIGCCNLDFSTTEVTKSTSTNSKIYLSSFITRTDYPNSPNVIDAFAGDGVSLNGEFYISGDSKINNFSASGVYNINVGHTTKVYGSDDKFYGEPYIGTNPINISLSSFDTKNIFEMGESVVYNCSLIEKDGEKPRYPSFTCSTMTPDTPEFGNTILKYFALNGNLVVSPSLFTADFSGCGGNYHQGATVFEQNDGSGKWVYIGDGEQKGNSSYSTYQCYISGNTGYETIDHVKVVIRSAKGGQEIAEVNEESGLFSYSPVTGYVSIDADVLVGKYVEVVPVGEEAQIARSVYCYTPNCTYDFDEQTKQDGGIKIGRNDAQVILDEVGSFKLPTSYEANRISVWTNDGIKSKELVHGTDYNYTYSNEKGYITFVAGHVLTDLIVYANPASKEQQVDITCGEHVYKISGDDKVAGGENYVASFMTDIYGSEIYYLPRDIEVKVGGTSEGATPLTLGKDYAWDLSDDKVIGVLTVFSTAISDALWINVKPQVVKEVTIKYVVTDDEGRSVVLGTDTGKVGDVLLIKDPAKDLYYTKAGFSFVCWQSNSGNKYYSHDIFYVTDPGEGKTEIVLRGQFVKSSTDKLDDFIVKYLKDVEEIDIPDAYNIAKGVFNDFDLSTRILFSTQTKYKESFIKMRNWAHTVDEDFNFSTNTFESISEEVAHE